MSMFLINFWRMYSNMLSKVNVFEREYEWMKQGLFIKKVPNEKEWRQQVKNQKRKAFYIYYFLCGVQKRLKPHFALIFFPRLQEIRNLF